MYTAIGFIVLLLRFISIGDLLFMIWVSVLTIKIAKNIKSKNKVLMIVVEVITTLNCAYLIWQTMMWK